MAKVVITNIKLGIFVIAGLLFLILLLYMIGRNQHLFGSNYVLRAQFENVQGLKAGHNVRYAGIEVGTVKKVVFLNDTLIEVSMLINDKMKNIIRKNSQVSVGTEGFVGNKVVNIVPGKGSANYAEPGDLLYSKKLIDTDEMLRTLEKTNSDIAVVADNLKTTIQNINSSEALWELLNEKTLPQNIKASALNVRSATAKAADMIDDLHSIVMNVKQGKGSVGAILSDTSFALNLNAAVQKIDAVGRRADSLAAEIKSVVSSVQYELDNGRGVANAILKDSVMTSKLSRSLDNIQKGTEAFNADMEALKHNFLLRGYFRKVEKQKAKEEKRNTAIKD